MNRTNVEHAIFALLMQAAVGLSTGDWWAGAALGAGFFLGREHAQWEKHLTHGGHVNGLNPLAGFAFLWRSKDGCLDFVVPLVAVVLVALAAPSFSLVAF